MPPRNTDDTPLTARQLMGDGQTATTTREKILDAAINLFYTHGFHAVGIDAIIAAVGVTKTTFYNHFESKDQLALESLCRRSEWERTSFREQVAAIAPFDPLEQILATWHVLDQWFNSPEFLGCQYISAAAEFPNPHDPIHKAAADFKLVEREDFRMRAEAAHLREPDVFAARMLMLIDGVITARQMLGDGNAPQHGREMTRLLIAAHGGPVPVVAKRK